MSKFPDDYPIEILRDAQRPNRTRTLRAMASRAAWLIKRIEYRVKLGEQTGLYVDELRAIANLIDIAQWPEIGVPPLVSSELVATAAAITTRMDALQQEAWGDVWKEVAPIGPPA